MPIQEEKKTMVETKTEAAKAADAKAAAESKAEAARPAESKESKGDKFDAAKVKAPGLTKEFVAKHKLDDEVLDAIARGEVPPPPTSAEVAKDPALTDGELHLTDGGWQITPVGVKPEEVAEKSKAISR